MTLEQYKNKHPDDIPVDFSEADYEEMLRVNPYRPSGRLFSTQHENVNRRFILGWIKGRYSVFNAIVRWIAENKTEKGWSMNKEDFRQMFAKITCDPNFGLPKTENNE